MPAVLSLVAGISGSSAEAPVPSFCSGWVPCSVSSCWPAKSGFCVASACSVSACVWSDESGAFGLAPPAVTAPAPFHLRQGSANPLLNPPAAKAASHRRGLPCQAQPGIRNRKYAAAVIVWIAKTVARDCVKIDSITV